MNSIDAFIATLQQRKNTSTVSNPYLDDKLANNLRLYLEAMMQVKRKRILLVGEAPGYKGCKITGIPFSSGMIFDKFDHKLLKTLKDKIYLSKVESENTATIVWEYLSEKKITPLFWNAFPFHPHPKNQSNKNRAPNAEEVTIGMDYLQQLGEIYQPKIIAGIGAKGTDCAQRAFPDKSIVKIRHPSFGGKSDFRAGMDALFW